MADQPTLFPMPGPGPGTTRKPGEASWPKWFRPSKACQRHGLRVIRGLHPTGQPLNEAAGRTCGGCAHLRGFRYSKSFYKCELDRAVWKGGPCTDVKRRWRACDRFEVAP